MMIPFKRGGILVLALVSFVLIQLPVYGQGQRPVSLTLQNEGFNDLPVEGMFGSNSAFLAFPSNWVLTQDIQVNLVYTASPVVNQEQSTLTVRVNGQNVFTLHPMGDGLPHTATFTIPRSLVTPLSNGIQLVFNGFIRVTSEVCEQPNNPGQWLTISNQTEFLLPTQESVTAPQLNQLPSALVVQRAFYTPPPVIFVLPDKWTPTIASAAAQIAARLGKAFAGKKPIFQMVRTSDLTPQMENTANLIIIGKSSDWPNIPSVPVSLPKATPTPTPAKGLILTPTPTLVAPTVSPSIGYIRIINSPWNPARKILLINATSDADLAQIASAFANDAQFALLQGPAIGLDALAAGEANVVPPSPWLSNNITFAQLGEGDRMINGTNPQNTYYELRLPDGWVLDPGAELKLNVVGSPALTSEVSHVDVYANNILIGAIADQRNGQEQQVALNFPVDRLQGQPGGSRTQNIELHLSVFNALILPQCQAPSSDSVAWTRINATSSIVVPHHYAPLPDLQAFPYPFLNDKEIDPVVIVLPQNPDDNAISDALTLAATLGNRAVTEFDVSITTPDQVTQDKYANANLILLGTKANQPLFDKFTGSLPSSKNAAVVTAFKNPDFGILYETASPWNAKRMMLFVSSGTANGYAAALTRLINSLPPVDGSGSIAIVGSDQASHVIYQAVTPTPTATPTKPAATATSLHATAVATMVATP